MLGILSDKFFKMRYQNSILSSSGKKSDRIPNIQS